MSDFKKDRWNWIGYLWSLFFQKIAQWFGFRICIARPLECKGLTAFQFVDAKNRLLFQLLLDNGSCRALASELNNKADIVDLGNTND